jgi:cytochrome c-type protein NapB
VIQSPDSKWFSLAAVAATASAGVVIFASAEREGAAPWAPPLDGPARRGEPAVSYRELADPLRRGPNAEMYAGALDGLRARVPADVDPTSATDEERRQALEERRARRAYDGAPPTIPHAVAERELDCVACHAQGAVIGRAVAPMRSHGVLPSCTQCHVPSSDPRPAPTPPALADNEFVGLEGRRRGERAWAGAPPTIPHPTLMRSECTSCHGPTGKLGLRTPHPDRASCTQCHTPSAEMDQRAATSGWTEP